MLTSREQILPVIVDVIPESLRILPRWTIWKAEPKSNEPLTFDKVPYCAFDPQRHASSSNSSTWATFEVALAAYLDRVNTGADGLLIATGDGLAGVDLDSVIDPDSGSLLDEARAIVVEVDSYAERSVSGAGVRIFAFAQEAKGVRHGVVEIYSRMRFLSVTGHHLDGSPLTVGAREDELQRLRERVIAQRAAARRTPRVVATRQAMAEAQVATPQGATVDISDEEIIATARAISPSFDALWSGETSRYDGDRSRADMAMACYLAYFCGPGAHDSVLRIMFQSGLVRQKWLDRPEYLSEMTIPRAYEECTRFYVWGQRLHGDGTRLRGRMRQSCELVSPDLTGSTAAADGGEDETGESRPTIIVGPETDAILNEAECHLATQLFQRCGKLVAVEEAAASSRHEQIRRVAGSLVIKTQTEEQVERLMSRHIRFMKVRVVGRGENRRVVNEKVAAPSKFAKLFTKCGQWTHIPRLTGIVTTPFMRRDGTIVWTPGYDEATGVLFFGDGTPWACIPEQPTAEQVQEAVDALKEVVCDFPFASPHHESAWLASLLQTVGRHAIDGPVPMLWVDANRKGTGKTKLQRAIGRIVLGGDPTEISFTSDEKELENRLAAMLMAGDRFAVFDNATGSIRNPVLDRFLTSRWFDFRRFHAQELVKLLNDASLAVTGNNLTLRGDLSRRVLRVRLVTEDESPESRHDFRHPNLDGFIAANRVTLFAAAMTILKAHAAAGFVPCTVRVVGADGVMTETVARTVGSFTEWDRVVRHAILRAGLPDPIASQDEVRAEDEDEVKLRAFLAAWYQFSPTCEGTATALIKQWFGNDGRESSYETDLLDLREAVHELTGTEIGKTPSPQTLGYRLRDAKDKKVGGYRVVKSEKKTNAGFRYGVNRDESASDDGRCDARWEESLRGHDEKEDDEKIPF